MGEQVDMNDQRLLETMWEDWGDNSAGRDAYRAIHATLFVSTHTNTLKNK